MKELITTVQSEFEKRFKGEPVLIKSPGRVNLIGEHTDYNDGFVLPAAIDKVIVFAFAPNNSSTARFVALDMDDSYSVDLSEELEKSGKHWPDYILGIIDWLQKEGYDIEGFDCVFGGNIPIGAGLSSSAALDGGIVFGLSELFDLNLSKRDMAVIGKKSDNSFVGVQCGIMDQFINIHGEKNCALKLDCRSLDYEIYPFKQENIRIVLCDTKIRRELANSEYNIRQQQCEAGVSLLKHHGEDVNSLRDVDERILFHYRDKMDPTVYDRCLFVVEENSRVQAACEDLLNRDLVSFGEKMYESHKGLKELYEVSCEELDVLQEEAQQTEGVLGSRMMGGGFGGCTINLVEKSAIPAFRQKIKDHYRQTIGKDIDIYQTRIDAGTHVIGQKEEQRVKE